MEDVFLNFVRQLNEANVEYLVIGGHAVIVYGYVRTTTDLDLLVKADPANADKLIGVLLQNGFEPHEFEQKDFTLKPNFVSIRLGMYWIELMTETLHVDWETARANRQVFEFQGVPINFIGLSDLLKNKRAVGRPKDLLDLDNLPNPDA
jgi:hypothetical protein